MSKIRFLIGVAIAVVILLIIFVLYLAHHH